MNAVDTRNVLVHTAGHYEARYSLNAVLETSNPSPKKNENPGNSYFVVHLKGAGMLDAGRSELAI